MHAHLSPRPPTQVPSQTPAILQFPSFGDPAAPRRAVAILGGICIALGIAVLIGWLVHSLVLIQLSPTMAPMQFNTALCFVLAGAALVAWPLGRLRPAVPILGGLVFIIGGLTLSEYLFHADLRIDQLLFKCYVTTDTSNLGRMSPVTSFCFALSGLALLSLSLRGTKRWRPLAVGSLASIISSITLVALIGYVLGLPGTYGWGQLTRIAMHTATGLCLVGTALFIIAWNIATHQGERTPRWLPVPLALGVLAGSLVLYFALEGKQDEDIAQTVRANAQGAKDQIAVRMDARFRWLSRMAMDWEFMGAPTQAAWESSAAGYVRDLPDVQALEWIDATRRLRWIVPVAGNEAKVGSSTLEDQDEAVLDQARQENRPVVTHIVSLGEEGLGFVIYVPITVKNVPNGYLAAVFKAETCLQRYLPDAVADGEAITVSEGGKVFFKREADNPPLRKDWVVQQRIELHGATWMLRMWPTPALAERLDSPLPAVVLCAGALGALMLGAVSFYAQRSSRQAAETTRANDALREALGQVETLEGLLPICCYCKRVRDDTGYWSQIDTYLRKHTKASLSHGYCPECAVKFYEECGLDVPDKIKAEVAAGNYE